MVEDARKAAVKALQKVHSKGSYSNVTLDSALNTGGLNAADKALMSRLFYGVIERQITLDYILSQYSRIPLKKMHPVVRDILRVGCYQLAFMTRIPASAAVNEAVKAARSMNQERSAGFINAVLRAVDRNRERWYSDLKNDVYGLSIRCSCPTELISLWEDAYGKEMAAAVAESANEAPPITIRINTIKISVNVFIEKLKTANIPFKQNPVLPECIHLMDASGLKWLAQTLENCYYHQDAASQLCCKALEAKPGERIADVCAAPGGKSMTLAQYMENKGTILAGDIYPAKCETMVNRARQQEISIIHTVVRDASLPCAKELVGSFDRVLCDAPCSGLGVIRRKPEIRYKSLASLSQLPELQQKILHQSAQLVKSGGILQYSTCTLNPAENQETARQFLSEHPDFEPRVLPLDECFSVLKEEPSFQITLFPPVHHTDGFYIAGFQKTR